MNWKISYTSDILKRDALAALTVAAISLPQAMAYALLAGVDPRYGLGSSCVSGGYSKMHERRAIIPSLEPGFSGWFLTN